MRGCGNRTYTLGFSYAFDMHVTKEATVFVLIMPLTMFDVVIGKIIMHWSF